MITLTWKDLLCLRSHQPKKDFTIRQGKGFKKDLSSKGKTILTTKTTRRKKGKEASRYSTFQCINFKKETLTSAILLSKWILKLTICNFQVYTSNTFQALCFQPRKFKTVSSKKDICNKSSLRSKGWKMRLIDKTLFLKETTR